MSLETNLQLKSLNVCRNAFSDQGVTALLRVLKFNNSVKTVSLAENNAGDAVCATVQLLLIGFEVRAEEEAVMESSADRIKAWNEELKAVNRSEESGVGKKGDGN